MVLNLLDLVRERFTIRRVKTGIYNLLLFIIVSSVCASAFAGTAPSQSANLINVNDAPVSAVQAPTPIPAPNKNCQICYGLISVCCDSFVAVVTIQNKGTTPVKGWTLRWNYAGNQAVTYTWEGNTVQSGKTVSVVNANDNQTIPAGGCVYFGLQACYSGANITPTVFSLQ